MTYSTLIENEGIESAYLIVLKPARKPTWTIDSGNIYYNTFNYGYVSKVELNGVEQTLHTSKTVTSGKYYYDTSDNKVYVYSTAIATDVFIVTYELYISTKDANWYRDPLDAASYDAYYEPMIIREPQFKASLSDNLMGFMPSSSSNLEINNATHWLEYHLYDSSFKNKEIVIYHWLGDLSVANISKLVTSKMGNVNYNNEKVSINILDPIDTFENEWRNPTISFYSSSTFTELLPQYEGYPVRYVYGMAEGVNLVNLDYTINAPTTSDNRTWGAREDATSTVVLNKTCGGGTHTTTKTFLTSTSGLNIGDRCKFDRASGTDNYAELTNVTATYIEHAALADGAMVDADTVKRGTIGAIDIDQNGQIFKAMYLRDWTESSSNGVLTVVFPSGLEAGLSMSTMSGSEKITARIYGKTNNVTKGGGAFGSDSTTYGCLTNPAVILFDILKSRVGLGETNIDLDTFTTLNTAISGEEVGFTVPFKNESNFPTYKEVINKLIQTNLLKIFINTNKKWAAVAIRAMGAKSFSIEEDEILNNSIKYKLSYDDIISEINIRYRIKDDDASKTKQVTSTTGKYLHGVNKSKNIDSLLLDDVDASTLATRYAAMFGDRKGNFDISCKNRFLSSYINDIIEVSLEKILGYAYKSGTLRTKNYIISELDKDLRKINITLDDQKGIEDNSSIF